MKKSLILFLLMFPTATLADTSLEAKCYTNEELLKTIETLPVITMYNVKNKDGKMEDIMLDLERKKVYTVQYDQAADGNALTAKQYCVTSIDSGVTINSSFIEFFSKLMDRMQGQKI